ncbi:MAG: DNA mismatch repair endonuclease MutL, partial [Gemmataceae bacterium]
EVRPWNGSPGTRIEVRHLFYSVPVRKKFLKAIPTELGHVTEAITRIALAHEGLHITLRHNGKSVIEVPGSATLADRIGLFFGAEVQAALLPVQSPPGPLAIRGLIADPTCDRGNSRLQYLFINNRWFRDRSLAFALEDAYRGLLMVGRHPVGFLFLTVPPDLVDVNVHPTKAEVRFRDNGQIFSLIRGNVKTRLLQENLIPRLEVPAAERLPFSFPSAMPAPTPQQQLPEMAPLSPRRPVMEANPAPWELRPATRPVPPLPMPVPIVTLPPEDPTPEIPPTPQLPIPEPADLAPLPRTAFQMHDSYIIQETPQGMLVIDQHALHERILYEQLRRRIEAGNLEIQRLLIPEPVELPGAQAAIVLDAAPALAELGLEIADFGGGTIMLQSYPTLLSRRAPYQILQGVIDELLNKERPPSKAGLVDHLLATMACKAAVKAGDPLAPEEIQALL